LHARNGLDDSGFAVSDVTDRADVDCGLARYDLRRKWGQFGRIERREILLRQMRSVKLILSLNREGGYGFVLLYVEKMDELSFICEQIAPSKILER